MTEVVNICGLAMKGTMPIEGGLLDQSAWFISALQRLQSEQNQIDNERAERMRSGRR